MLNLIKYIRVFSIFTESGRLNALKRVKEMSTKTNLADLLLVLTKCRQFTKRIEK